jgi:hypothetical protein
MSYLICIKHKGKSYCWNSETEQIEEITAKPISIGDCPEVVVFDLMRSLGREANAAKGKE